MTQTRSSNPLQWAYLKSLFRPELMSELLCHAENTGMGQATYVDGSPRDNVQTLFLQNDGHPATKPVFERIIDLSATLGDLFKIEVYPNALEFIQIARYLPGDHYGAHVDHDTSLTNLKHDRKVSLFVSLTTNGQLEVEGLPVNVGIGDAVAFPATMYHAAPEQTQGTRYSFVAWILGPPWR